jgi:hypothetical protein
MHVYRLHSSEATPTPAHTRGAGTSSGVSGSQQPSSTDTASATGSGSQVQTLLGLLSEIPQTRNEVVARAREKVANGDYLTRPSAEATAEVFLRSV